MSGNNRNISSADIRDDWMLWEKLLLMGGEINRNRRDVVIDEAVDSFLRGITDDPSYQPDALVEGINIPLVATRKTTLECSIKAAPGTNLHIGDLVECLNEKWLVVELYTDKVGILNGAMWVCNELIRFQNNSEKVVVRNCVIDDGSYTRKTSDPVAYVPTNTYSVYLSMDEETVKLYLDKRLSFGKIFSKDGSEILEVYKITGIDGKSRNFGEGSHLMVLTIQRDVFNNTTDSIESELCDVHIDSEETSAPAETGNCTIAGKDTVRIGTTRKYSAIFTDSNGQIAENVIPVWETVKPSSVVVEVSDDEKLSITIPLDEALIGSEVVIRVKDTDGVYGTFEKKVQVTTIG